LNTQKKTDLTNWSKFIESCKEFDVEPVPENFFTEWDLKTLERFSLEQLNKLAENCMNEIVFYQKIIRNVDKAKKFKYGIKTINWLK
jgi:hypothetical protein